jgi:hypothetical protein
MIFKFGVDDIKKLFPAPDFSPTPESYAVDSALDFLSPILLGPHLDEIKETLKQLFRRTGTRADPVKTLCNIRRWAIKGLLDKDLALKLEERLVAPDASPEHCQYPSMRRAKTSKSITAKQAQSILANAFIGDCLDPMTQFKDPWNGGGLDFREMLLSSDNELSLAKME